jgi:Protein of unknown function (DUF3311)
VARAAFPGPSPYIIADMPGHRAKKRNSFMYWLLLLPLAGLLFPGIYSRTTPALFGFPFFYWYQFAWVLITAGITGLVYLLTNVREN